MIAPILIVFGERRIDVVNAQLQKFVDAFASPWQVLGVKLETGLDRVEKFLAAIIDGSVVSGSWHQISGT